MASRAFSTSARVAKEVHWKLIGATVPVDFYTNIVEIAIEGLPPKYAATAKVGLIQIVSLNPTWLDIINIENSGNPHPSPSNNDPLHAPGRIGEGSVKGKNRLSSFHAYSDGRVTFSDPDLQPFNKGPSAATVPTSRTPEKLAVQLNDWQLDTNSGKYWRWAADGKTVEWYPGTVAGGQ